jgi:quercetin dioxygenase-like cupin family protein
MSHRADIAQGHKTRGVEEERMEKAAAHIPPGEGRSLWVLGELVTYKVSSDQTSGAYSLFEVTTPPGGESPPHVQHREDESFFVLEGEYEFLLEDRLTRMGAGSSVYVPKGNLHAHKNVGEGPARMLIGHTPGRAHERFFEEVGRCVKDLLSPSPLEAPPSMEEIVAIAAGYGIEIPPPEKQTQAKEAT